MAESQNIEWKESWRDEYLKWICGFANAQGGKIYIGKSDKGGVVGIDNVKRLMDDLPNKIVTNLGIICDINLITDNSKDIIEIIVEPYPNPVNYKGQYHYRTGSTKQELKGAALDKFMLERKGKRWDGVPVPNISITDLKKDTFDFFRKRAVKAQRIEDDVLTDTDEQLADNLQLTENEYLKRAAILLFHPKPTKFVTGASIKIGYFETDDELKFQDEILGNIFEQVEKAMDLLFTKYIKSSISYEGLNRVEKYEYPKNAVREALLNAVSHKDYSGGVPIQISVYNDKLIFWNEGQLPENWTIDKLLTKHPSKPYNPDIANALFRSGYIESWGRGTIKIINECVQFGIPEPKYYYDMSGFWVEFRKDNFNIEYFESLGLNKRQIEALKYVKEKGKITNSEYQSINDCSRNTASNDLVELVNKELLESSGQKGAGAYYNLKNG